MHDFTITLPFETIRLILSYLDHSDHVECMLVCHRWHDLIPIFAFELWDHLLVTSDSWPKTNERLLLCLGPHIQYLFIQEAPPCQVLNTLKDKECKLTLLELACYRNFCVSNSSSLVTAMAQFGTTLKEIHITDLATPDIPEHKLLDSCPNLTHLTLLFAIMNVNAQSQDDMDRVNKNTKLLYLHMDNGINFETRVMEILRRSPKLRSLVMSNHPYRTFQDCYLSGVYFNDALNACPHLRYVSWNENQDSAADTARYDSWMQLVNCNNQDDTAFLTELVFQGVDDDVTKIVPVLHSQHKLEYMKLLSHEGNICPFAGMKRSHLKTLFLEQVKMSREEWVPFLKGCPELESFTVDTQLNATDIIAIIQGVQSLKNLQHLYLLSFFYFSMDCRLPMDTFNILSTNNIRSLSLRDIPISDEGLLVMCNIPSLRALNLSMPQFRGLITADGFLAFAEKLQFVNSQLHTLSLSWFTNLTDTVVEHFAQVKNLTSLAVSLSNQITDAGVQAFTSRNKKISVNYCPYVSESYG